jgi:hypothetical protein
VIRFTPTLILVLCICRLAFAQTEWPNSAPVDVPEAVNLFPNSFAELDGISTDFTRPVKKLFTLEVGPKLVELHGSYFEKPRPGTVFANGFGERHAAERGRYFDLFAKSSHLSGKLVAEGEVAYSTLGPALTAEQRPVMTRLGLNGRWSKTGYGLSVRSLGDGFVFPTGAGVANDHSERQIWAEYDFGLFRVRGAGGEAVEINSATHQQTVTQSAVTSFYLQKPNWKATLSSSYSLIGHGKNPSDKNEAFANGLSLFYKPVSQLTLEPSLNFKQEWDVLTGLKTDTPSAAFTLAYAPIRDIHVNGRASYARDLSEDPLKSASILNTAAAVNWKVGKSFLGEHSLSLQLEYKNESRPALPDDSHSNVIGVVKLNILGFCRHCY